jgi:hypothetical protein
MPCLQEPRLIVSSGWKTSWGLILLLVFWRSLSQFASINMNILEFAYDCMALSYENIGKSVSYYWDVFIHLIALLNIIRLWYCWSWTYQFAKIDHFYKAEVPRMFKDGTVAKKHKTLYCCECTRYFHVKCVGLNMNNILGQWTCYSCALLTKLFGFILWCIC